MVVSVMDWNFKKITSDNSFSGHMIFCYHFSKVSFAGVLIHILPQLVFYIILCEQASIYLYESLQRSNVRRKSYDTVSLS